MFDSPFIIPVVAIVCWAIIRIVRIRSGQPRVGWFDADHNRPLPPMFEKMLGKAMAERDEQADKLRKRIEVLEKIVTDNHKSSTLSDEIERLREQQS